MKLTLAIATAFSGLAYLIVKNFAPDFPISEDQFQQAFFWLLSILGVVVTEFKLRAALIARGFDGFK